MTLGGLLLVAFIIVETLYWFVYVPRAWRTPGMNREIDDIKFVYEHVYRNGDILP